MFESDTVNLNMITIQHLLYSPKEWALGRLHRRQSNALMQSVGKARQKHVKGNNKIEGKQNIFQNTTLFSFILLCKWISTNVQLSTFYLSTQRSWDEILVGPWVGPTLQPRNKKNASLDDLGDFLNMMCMFLN